jgi:PleD family two-component response regulator
MAATPIQGADGEIRVTVSAGCAQVDESEPTREALLRTADVALFMAKRGGRDRVVAA